MANYTLTGNSLFTYQSIQDAEDISELEQKAHKEQAEYRSAKNTYEQKAAEVSQLQLERDDIFEGITQAKDNEAKAKSEYESYQKLPNHNKDKLEEYKQNYNSAKKARVGLEKDYKKKDSDVKSSIKSANKAKSTMEKQHKQSNKATNKLNEKQEKSGVIYKGATVNVEEVSNKPGWYKIVSVPVNRSTAGNSKSLVGSYVQLDGNNFDDSAVTMDATDPKALAGVANADKLVAMDKPELYENNNETYSTLASAEAYENTIENGLDMSDLKAILGMPPQFLPTTDLRVDGSGSYEQFGRVYSKQIVKNMPLLLMIPGIPEFLSKQSRKQRYNAVESLFSGADGIFNKIVNSKAGKYYTLKYQYTEYYDYVNTMLRLSAEYLGISNEKINGKRLSQINWLYNGTDIQTLFSGGYEASYIPFYVDSGTEASESFSNNTGQSTLASQLNSLSEQARELNFLMGNVGGTLGYKLDALTGQENLGQNIENVNDALTPGISALNGGNNIFATIVAKAQTILAGGRLIFPEIWTDSSFGRSYSCKMKLVSTSGDKLSVFLNILVPLYHLLAFVMPRQSTGEAYYSPFLVRAYYKGLFNVDMGIIQDLSVSKGAEGEWTIDGIPTVCEISFTIKELYEQMSMSPLTGKMGITSPLSNIAELDYIANTCGINVNDEEVVRTIKLFAVLNNPLSKINDTLGSKILGSIAQFFDRKTSKMFGVFH